MDDLISRQDALKALDEMSYKSPHESATSVVRKKHFGEILEKFIMQQPSAQQWIPCSERLPEKFGDYLVSVKRHGWNCEEHIENDIAYWDDLEGFHKAEEVLAWMPLPEIYKGEKT